MSNITEEKTQSGLTGVSITNANATNARCRGVYCGTSTSYDISFDGSTWVLFQGMTAGLVYPFQATGARRNSGSAAPTAGDIVFLY